MAEADSISPPSFNKRSLLAPSRKKEKRKSNNKNAPVSINPIMVCLSVIIVGILAEYVN
jgi:hypothetical protein